MAKRALWIGWIGALIVMLMSGCAGVPTRMPEGAADSAAPPMAAPAEPQEAGEWDGAPGARSRSEMSVINEARMIIYTGELSLVVVDKDDEQARVVAIEEESGV